MPDLLNIYDIAQASGKQSVYVFNDRCTPVQHRRSSCRKCIDACPVGAIALDARTLKVDHVACIGCGACTTVCPTEAIISIDPTADILMGAAVRSMNTNGGAAVVACERISSRDAVKEEHFAKVPCLCRVHESMLVDLVALGAKRLFLVDGGCKNCKMRDCDATTESVVRSADDLLEKVGSDVRVERVSVFPAEFEREEESSIGEQRRAAFEEAGVSSKDILGRAFKLFAKQETENNKISAAVVNALGIDLDDPEPFAPRRQEKLVNALFTIGERNGRLSDPFVMYAPKTRCRKDSSAEKVDDKSGSGADGTNGDGGSVGTMSSDVLAERSAGNSSDAVSGGEQTSKTDEGGSLTSHFFGMLEFNDMKCNQCGICAVVCKHDAMCRSTRKTPEGKTYFIEFTPSKCVQCKLCEEACFRKAITVSDTTPFAALFSFEPVCYK